MKWDMDSMEYLYLGMCFILGIIVGWVIGQWKKNEHKIKIAEQSRKEGFTQGRSEGRAEGWEGGWDNALNDMSNWCKSQVRKKKTTKGR
jgi:hypothetical protein